jgi:hypothetical protein
MIDVDHNPLETEDGVWTQYNGSKLLIAHVSSMAFQRKLARLQQPYAKKIEKGTLSPDVQKEILCKAMAGTILKDAEFVRYVRVNGQIALDEQGKKRVESIPFTVDLAEKVLANQVDVREFVTEYSGNLDNYRAEEAEEVGKS